MAVKDRVYLFSVNDFKEPEKREGVEAVALSLVRIILLEPGSDPLHPDMGVGLKSYRYKMDGLEDLRKRIEDQIATYLPMYQGAMITLIKTPDKVCNIEIVVEGVTYVYDSLTAPVPILLEDIKNY